jgi:hypothetical protein
MSQTISKTRKVINFLSNGGSLTAAQARARFGVQNLRATISNIRNMVEEYGNWEIVTTQNNSGRTSYSMVDTHPGRRTYRFNKDGTRTRVSSGRGSR